MPEEKVKVGQDTGRETVKVKTESPVKEAVKKPKSVKAAASKPSAPAEVKEKKATAIDDIMAAIKNMTVLELSQLIKALEAEFGVSATAVPVVAATPTAAAPTEAVGEKTEFSVVLKAVGANKISVIRVVRELTALGLKESKDLVESAPKAVKEGVSKDEAMAVKEKLEAAGATVEIT